MTDPGRSQDALPSHVVVVAQLSCSAIAALPWFRSHTRDTHTQIFELASR